MLEAGADLLAVHGRTPAQRYEGAADKEAVCLAARRFHGLIAGSGDYYAPSDAKTYLDGGCVAVLAARGVLRDTFLIPRTLKILGLDVPRSLSDPTVADQLSALVDIGRCGIAREGERFTLVLVKRMLAGLFKGFPGAAGIRQSCARFCDWASMEKFLSECDLF
jgi:tRNA-dihydrouridine synthase B